MPQSPNSGHRPPAHPSASMTAGALGLEEVATTKGTPGGAADKRLSQFSDPGEKEGNPFLRETHFLWGSHQKHGKLIGAAEQLS